MKLNSRGSGIVVALSIIALAVIIIGGFYYLKTKSNIVPQANPVTNANQAQYGNKSIVGKSLNRGLDVECMNRLRQIRIQLENYSGEEKPQSLNDLGLGVSQDYLACPVSKQPYMFDSASGRVWCQNPAHSKY